METDRARHAKDLETLRSSFARELEAYKTELDRTVLVTRTQFETEFNAMKLVLHKLAQVRLRMNALRPFSGVTPGGATEGERRDIAVKKLHENLQAFNIAYNELLAVVEDLSPNYDRRASRGTSTSFARARWRCTSARGSAESDWGPAAPVVSRAHRPVRNGPFRGHVCGCLHLRAMKGCQSTGFISSVRRGSGFAPPAGKHCETVTAPAHRPRWVTTVILPRNHVHETILDSIAARNSSKREGT